MSDATSSLFSRPGVISRRCQPIGGLTKRLIDIFLSLSAIVLLAPLLLLCFAALTLAGGPAIFGHRRIGYQQQPFNCFKFRSMAVDSEERLQRYLMSSPDAAREWAETRKLRHDPRVTAIGAMLRRTSLDELPQLFNVLIGDMSIVGPRPITPDELARYSQNAEEYCACRPGITGLWQVSGRSTVSYETRVALDVNYVNNWSLALDAKIMIWTLPALLESDNAY